MPKNQSPTTTDRLSSGILQRKAISASGCLGSLYDIHRDCLVEKVNMTTNAQADKSYKLAQCVLINGSTNESWNLLQSIGIQDDLRLSLLLNLAPTVGIAGFMNHHREMNTFTRILYYSYQEKEKHLPEGAGRDVKLANFMKLSTNATHVISGICFGIDAVIILEISCDVNITLIDCVLSKFRSFLSNDNDNTLALTPNEKNMLKLLKNTTVYSNMPALTNIKKIFDIPQRIAIIKKTPHQCRPITYYLRPLNWLYPQYEGKETPFYIFPSDLTKSLEQSVLDLRTLKNNLEISFQETKLTLLSRYLEQHISGSRQQWFDLKENCNKEMKRLSDLIIDYRKSQSGIAEIKKALNDKSQTTLKSKMHELVQQTHDLRAKADLISDLKQKRFDYYNVVEHNVVKSDQEKDLQRKLIKEHQDERIICSSDDLNRSKSERSVKLHSDLIKQRRQNSNLRLIYADFSYCSYKLSDIMILSSTDSNKNKKVSKKKTKRSSTRKSHTSVPPLEKQEPPSPTVTKAETSTLPPSSSSPLPIDNTINILLLGETGVGKSTFINAFVNYLAFDSFEQARSNEPTVLITASFLITTGDDFEEHIIKIVDFDNSNNEDFDHPGQSVTQQCRSYVFPLRHSSGRKLRIIDTPGFGDTRGIDQDDLNIEHILQYINNLTHLNAICFLLKPNASRLNMFFQTCFLQLFSLLGSNAQQNIIFCFTNARSTFYTPGDTAPLLKNMLQSLPMNDIPFNKENAFCFDNESFRYLVALQNGISFNEDDKHEYEMSWLTSVRESNRLLEYISTKLNVYRMQDGMQSIKHAQLEISLLIRPMLEAIRNILRNLILCKKNLQDQSINMCSKPLNYLAARCLSCKSDPIEVAQFWIIPDLPHKIQNDCLECSCAYDQHIPINYILEYEACNDDSNIEEEDDMIDMLDQLCNATVEFAHFLMYVARSTKDDPFWTGLVQMIMDENDFNLQLAEELRIIQKKYEQKMSKMKQNKKNIELTMIYKLMHTIKEYPMIDEQMLAVKQTQETMMEQYEYEVSKI
jgi:GTP-binding protein EngB required for normal cell division